MQTATFQSCNSGASENAIVIVKETVRRLAEVSEQKVEMIHRALGQIASFALSTMPEIRWQLKRGPLGIGSSALGGRKPAETDIAWDLLTSVAVSAIGLGEISVPKETEFRSKEIEVRQLSVVPVKKIRTTLFRHPTQIVAFLKEGAITLSREVENMIQRQLKTLNQCDLLLEIRETSLARDDEMLQFRIAARVIASAGNLEWHDCLALANARARYHQFIDADDPKEDTQIRHQVITSDGGLVVHVAIKERRLPVMFREHYERQKLIGRIQILSELVEFAKREHLTRIHISSQDMAKQSSIETEALLRTIRAKTGN
jgi:hypothetical protein